MLKQKTPMLSYNFFISARFTINLQGMRHPKRACKWNKFTLPNKV
jgi:hypothetical protein